MHKMIKCYLIIGFLLFLSFFSVDNAFRTEGLIGGNKAREPLLRYQAAIMGKYTNINRFALLCGAAIISNYLLLSAARCFIKKDNQLRTYTFYAIVGQIFISGKHRNLRDIEIIYTFGYEPVRKNNDLSVSKLKESLFLEINQLTLFWVEIPTPFKNISELDGNVIGFGAKSLSDKSVLEARERIRLNSKEEHELTEAQIKVNNASECVKAFPKSYPENSFCGQIRVYDASKRGICVGDIGSPFVHGREVIGIASQHNLNCDDTEIGALYTKVSAYTRYINSLKRGVMIPGIDYRYNHPFAPTTAC